MITTVELVLTIIVATAALTLGVLLGEMLFEYKAEKAGYSDEKIEAAKKKAIEVIKAVGLGLLTAAEREYGDKTGQLKMSSVISKLLAVLPDEVGNVISTEWLQTELEKALDKAKELWNTNKNMLGGDKK